MYNTFYFTNFISLLIAKRRFNCMGSISIVNIVLKEKSMGAKETKEFYFSVKTAGISNKNWVSLGTNYTFTAEVAHQLIQEFSTKTTYFFKSPLYLMIKQKRNLEPLHE